MPQLPSLLASLSTPQPFEVIVPSGSRRRAVYLEALTWLLRQDLVVQIRVCINLLATADIKKAAYEREQARHKFASPSNASVNNMSNEHNSISGDDSLRKCAKGVDTLGLSEEDDEENPNQSSVTISSGSAPSTVTGAGSSDGFAHSSETRSPLPASFPQNYPYISALSASSMKPRTSALHGGHGINDDQARKSFLAALSAPSIIANPSELSSEEELWISEIIEHVQANKGSDSIPTFYR